MGLTIYLLNLKQWLYLTLYSVNLTLYSVNWHNIIFNLTIVLVKTTYLVTAVAIHVRLNLTLDLTVYTLGRP